MTTKRLALLYLTGLALTAAQTVVQLLLIEDELYGRDALGIALSLVGPVALLAGWAWFFRSWWRRGAWRTEVVRALALLCATVLMAFMISCAIAYLSPPEFDKRTGVDRFA